MQTSLIAMTASDFSEYLKIAIPAYAKDNIDAGRWEQKDALERAEKAYQSLLPEGIATINNYLFNVGAENTNVGYVWVKIEAHIQTKSAFIYDIEIFEQHRRKGYAKSALQCVEQIVADMGATNLGLHVFNQNSAAIGLYQSIGYETVSHNMQKKITKK